MHERAPAWSPDGTRIAYFSDAGGEYGLVVEPQDGKGAAKTFKLAGAGFYGRPGWSPDGKKIAYTDNSWSLFWIDLDTGVAKKVASEPLYGPLGTLAPSWSPDSKWLVYTLNTHTYFQTVHVHSVDQGKSFAITDGLSEVTDPVFDRSGKYLYFFGSTDAGPVKDWFAMSNADMRVTRSLYLMVLRKDLPSPLAKESDEEKERRRRRTRRKRPPPRGLRSRVVDRPSTGCRTASLPSRVPAGELRRAPGGRGRARSTSCKREESRRRAPSTTTSIPAKDETLLPDVAAYMLSGDGKKVGYRAGQAWGIGPAKGKIDPAQGRLNVDAIEVKIDPLAEWPQIFDEAWRVNRDYFYAPNMHGVDWAAMKKKYSVFLPAPGGARRPEPRHPVDVQRDWRRPSPRRRRRLRAPKRPACRAACSAPTTPWRTAATASRRSTAA